jgi:alkanesulfonate monooxygenase SsuD/methylene tetrahydromethanopterin reductase-like flavin-dependent oxidoreductase (luciferase family)
VAFLRKAWTTNGRFSHHGKRWHYEDIIVEPAPVQKPHPPLWIGAFSHDSIRQAAENGFNLLLGQNGSPELVAESIGVYRKAVEARGRLYDPMTVGLTRALHIAMNQEEREAAHRLRVRFMRNVQQLSLSPSGDPPTLGRPRRALGVEEMRKATETDALIGTPEEIVERIERLRAGGVEYVLLIDVGGSLSALRTFAREVMPEFID